MSDNSDYNKIFESPQTIEIIKYCLKFDKFQFMWGATILGLIFQCDFRDAGQKAKDFLESIGESYE